MDAFMNQQMAKEPRFNTLSIEKEATLNLQKDTTLLLNSGLVLNLGNEDPTPV
jgi:hypothetical protein